LVHASSGNYPWITVEGGKECQNLEGTVQTASGEENHSMDLAIMLRIEIRSSCEQLLHPVVNRSSNRATEYSEAAIRRALAISRLFRPLPLAVIQNLAL
jgi:hypothetical protein